MICPNCSFENPDRAKFCQECGQPLPRPCPNCGAFNPATANFCANCGYKFSTGKDLVSTVGSTPGTSLSVDPRLARLAAATPTPLAEKMRLASQLAGERRVVTVLFADVVSSTMLAEHMDPEDWTEIMNRAFDLLVPAIYRYEGTIARLMGDALLAFFGAPVAHEDDPVRAVRAGLDLLTITKEYAEEVRHRHGIDFALRVGLNTGSVVVGEVGSNLVYEYTAMGDAVNLAARMQSAARPMTLLISDNTYRFIAPLFDVQDLGSISVKGKTEPVQVYEVFRPMATPGRLRGLSGLDSPMVGRESELNTLIDLSLTLQNGAGQVALIIGEAGLGKTRLINEWKNAISAASELSNPPLWIEGHSLSYGQSLAYHLLIDLLRNMLGVATSSSEPVVQQALKKFCEELFGANSPSVFPYLGHILSIQLEGDALERVRSLDPQTLQAQYQIAFRQLLTALSRRQPIILILEDIHWADSSSTDLLAKLLPLAAENPIIYMCLTRPDLDSPGWKLVNRYKELGTTRVVEINLLPLSEEYSQQLVTNLLEIGNLPPKIQELILSKAEGNPFFVEEVIRMLIDQGVFVQKENSWLVQREIDTVEIPDTLQGLLLARIDRLPEDVKHTLRVASVIGRQFSVKVLEQVLARRTSSN